MRAWQNVEEKIMSWQKVEVKTQALAEAWQNVEVKK